MAGIRRRWESNEVAGGMVAEIQLGNELIQNLFPESLLEFHFGISRTGYGWIFPKGDVLNIGVGTLISEQRGIKKLFDSFVSNDSRLRKLPAPDCRYHLLPLGGFARRLCDS
jgi:digeranylgeranylglycerophospholipid reductase